MADDQSLLVLKQILNNLLLAVGSVPAPKFDNLAEWDRIAPPITQAAEERKIKGELTEELERFEAISRQGGPVKSMA
jgi:hypothetical protein